MGTALGPRARAQGNGRARIDRLVEIAGGLSFVRLIRPAAGTRRRFLRASGG
jgi:hypothetical protein